MFPLKEAEASAEDTSSYYEPIGPGMLQSKNEAKLFLTIKLFVYC